MTDAPPRFPDAAARRAVRASLEASGYREPEIRARLGAQTGRDGRPLGRELVAQGIDAVDGALAVLLRLFTLGEEMALDAACAALGAEAVAALRACGLLDARSAAARPTAQLSAAGDLVLAADLRERHVARAADYVLGPFGSTLELASLTMRRRVESVLDLGCGSGLLGLLAATHCERVVATDVNPRAVAFSRFNVELNDVRHVACRAGDLFEPVRGERFDLIVCNPPYAISPAATYTYRDGGDAICRRIVRAAPRHLTESGHLQMLVEWPERKDADWRAAVTSWLAGVGCHAWLLRFLSATATQYAEYWLRQEYAPADPPAAAMTAWTDHLARLGIDAVGGGLLVLRRTRAAAPIRTLRDVPPMTPGPRGEAVAAWTAAQTLRASLGDDAALLDVPLAPAPHLERTDRGSPSGSGWTTHARELRIREGLRFGAKVDPVAVEIVGLFDGERTPREALELFTSRHGIDAEPFLGGLPHALATLLDLGLVIPAQGAQTGPAH